MTFNELLKSYMERKIGVLGPNNLPCNVGEKNMEYEHLTQILKNYLSTSFKKGWISTH